jgi:hypothetical protein
MRSSFDSVLRHEDRPTTSGRRTPHLQHHRPVQRYARGATDTHTAHTNLVQQNTLRIHRTTYLSIFFAFLVVATDDISGSALELNDAVVELPDHPRHRRHLLGAGIPGCFELTFRVHKLLRQQEHFLVQVFGTGGVGHLIRLTLGT